MDLEEKGTIAVKCVNQALRHKIASFELSMLKGGGINLKLKQHEFFRWKENGVHMANVIEQIFRKTGLIWWAHSVYKDCVVIGLYESERLVSCDKDGTFWEDIKHRARCPKCGDRDSFKLHRYNPEDTRGMTCPHCGFEGIVLSFWKDVK